VAPLARRSYYGRPAKQKLAVEKLEKPEQTASNRADIPSPISHLPVALSRSLRRLPASLYHQTQKPHCPFPAISHTMSSSFPQFSPARLRSYIFRLPFLTRMVLLVITGFWIVGFQSVWDVALWGALTPGEVGFGSSEFADLRASCYG